MCDLSKDAVAILMTRIPVAGYTKTRLAPALGYEHAAQLQRAMILDVAELLSHTVSDLTISYGDEWQRVEVAAPHEGKDLLQTFFFDIQEACNSACTLNFRPQCAGDLGQRMAEALNFELTRTHKFCFLMGSDLPEVQKNDIEQCIKELGSHDVVLAPTDDGGYWLVGLQQPFDELFLTQSWGTTSVLQEALARCEAAGKRFALGTQSHDVDTPKDFLRICQNAVSDVTWHAKRTADYLQQLKEQAHDIVSTE